MTRCPLLAIAAFCALGLLGAPGMAAAQLSNANVVATCGTPNTSYPSGATRAITQDTTGTLCSKGGGTAAVTATAAAGSVPVVAGTGKPLVIDLFSDLGVIVRDSSGVAVDWSAPVPIKPSTGSTTDKSGTVTLGGTAQNAIASNASRKGWCIQNTDAAEVMYVRVNGTASATTGTKLVAGAQACNSTGVLDTAAVSVFAATTAHPWSGFEVQ